ncbi:hypothetical protein TIFTF001_030635 [Ficus carica]|uniref:Ubiquitin-like protease family profile domain-containing protein n=1 Tax=Ficus carica TaxID=3494 RepID=A0AA88J361_FICCA|nr:hypothetical protein TIFTF001_030635 [Ficus carica]
MSQDHDEECSTQTEVGKPRHTDSPKFNPDEDGKRRATIMTRVHQVRTRGQRIEVSFDAKGQPLGKSGDELQSWIGVLAREHIPIWISDFRNADLAPRKELVWMEVVTSFTVDESHKRQVLKSCGESAKGFRYDLYQAFVRDHIDEENVCQRPPKVVHNYPTITQEDWEKFIQYRRTPEFKRLSEQGSEIRKKSKYGSTGGRDGYRKRDQAHFEKTGKYAELYERWLDMRVKPDGQFKKEEFKNIAETIEDITQQEAQGSFESVGTEDILTKALGNTKHSGRIRGQSKFVKQSQYFNLVRPPREKDDVEDMKLKIAALERTVQELCAKHGINRETIPEEMAGPTIDQHNSFKASCTMNEKEAGASDPNPTPNASKECQLFIPDLVNGGVVLVAIGRAYMDCVPTDTVHGNPLGEENVRVTITVPKINNALLPIPTNEATSIEEAVGGFVAWPKTLVVQTSLSQASKCPNRAPQREAGGSKRTKKRAGRNKLKSQPEVEQQQAQEEPPSFDFDNISFELRHLAFYAQSSMRDDGTQIICPQQHFVMGDDMPIYIGFEDVYHFITFKEISANSIMIYIRYLVECCARTGMDQRFEFISPGLVSPVQQNVDRATYVRERADNILRILRNAPKGKRFLMPYNSGQHWILAVIDLWDDSIMYFNPLGNEPGDDFKDLITTALNDWKVLVGSGMRQRRNWQTLIDTVRCPIHEGYVECGYFVLAYMREITFTVDGLDVLQTKDFYTDADMSLVRHEWATFVMRFIQY